MIKVTPEQYFTVQNLIIDNLSVLPIPTDEWENSPYIDVVHCLYPPPGYFTNEEIEEYCALLEGDIAEMKAEMNE